MSATLLKRVHEARTKTEMDIRSILDAAEARPEDQRSLTPDEQTNIDTLDAESRDLTTRLGEMIEAEERAQDVNASLAKFGGGTGDESAQADEKIEKQLRSLRSGEGVEVAATREARDLVKGTTTAGGHTVPTTFYGKLLEHMIEVSGVLQAGPTVLNTTSGENIDIPITTSFSTAAITNEAAALNESDPAFGKRTLGAYKYSVLVQVSRELVDDTGVDLLSFIARQAGRACGNAVGTHLVTGDGSSKPSGIVQTASTGVTGVTTGVSGAFLSDELIDLLYSVIAPYRNSPSCGWLMRDSTVAKVRKLKDTTGQYLWQPSLVAGTPDTLLGKPIHTDPNVAAVATSAKSIIFGDMSAYFVRLAGGIRFERSDDYAFANDLVTYRCIVRADGLLADQTGAVKVYVGASS